jgi:hypothetical protein
MNLDTNQLRAKIQKQIVRADERILEIQDEMKRLQGTEIPRMQQELATLDVVERIAGDYDNFPEAGLLDFARRRELEKLSAEIGVEIPPPPASAEEAAEQNQFFAQWS